MRGPHRRDAKCLALESAAAELKGDREIVVEAVEQLEAVKQNALAAPAVWLLIIIATCWLLIIIATCSLLGAARAMFSAAPSTAIWRSCGGYATLGPPPRLQGLQGSLRRVRTARRRGCSRR